MTGRRDFPGLAAALAASSAWPAVSEITIPRLPRRPIPGTDDSLPIVGLGNSARMLEHVRSIAA